MDWRLRHLTPYHSTHHKHLGNSGFSLVEVMVSTVILSAAVIGSVILYNLTTRNARLAENKQAELSVISQDVAQVFRVNDQFVCTTATSCGCTGGSCASSDVYPGEGGYIPNGFVSSTNDQSVQTAIQQICSSTTNGFGKRVADAINSSLPAPPEFNQLGIERKAEPNRMDSDATSPVQLYTVTWRRTSSNTILRQLTLAPTIAAWCP